MSVTQKKIMQQRNTILKSMKNNSQTLKKVRNKLITKTTKCVFILKRSLDCKSSGFVYDKEESHL